MEHLLQYDLDPQSTPESQPDPTLAKQQKAYEKKLKQYEKEKARWEYFQANKERIVKNKTAVERQNISALDAYKALSDNKTTHIKKNIGFTIPESILSTFESKKQEIPDLIFFDIGTTKKAILGELENTQPQILSGINLHKTDKLKNLYPIYKGAYIATSSRMGRGMAFICHHIFTFPPLPTKPTPPEKPQVKETTQELTNLKQEVITSKEMDISRKVYGDTVPTKLEVISNGKTIKVEKETYDLYIHFKATRRDRPHDLDLSFDHFKATYLDKHPQFMRKEQKKK